MTRHELAIRPLSKAEQDEIVVDRLIEDASVAEKVIGFHLQQASEKLLRAVLAEHGVDVRKTHNLIYLMDRLADCDLVLPAALQALQQRNPFAVEYRYDLLDDADVSGLDRVEMRELVRCLRSMDSGPSGRH